MAMNHKVKKIIRVSAILLIVVGVIAFGVIGCMYFFSSKQIENNVNDFKEKIQQLELNDNDAASEKSDSEDADRQSDEMKDSNYGNTIYEGNEEWDWRYANVNIEALKEDSERYNETLKEKQNTLLTSKTSYTYAALDLTKYGIYDDVYGYVSAPTIGMELPIYLGANDYTMAYGAGHLCYTSLPTGGEDTNVVLAGHTGYIGRWLFDSVPSLNYGDTVDITTYFGTLHYSVSAVYDKAAYSSQNMYIEDGKDKLTLITCIQGGYARRVVECERI